MEFGDVDVLITFSETSKVVPIYNESSSKSQTEESDDSGEKVVMPKIEGAIITAKGANNINVKNNIISAVEAATGLAVHKIQVFEMGN